MRRLRIAVAILGVLTLLLGLALVAHRMYAPGPLEERIDRAARRWDAFTEAVTWKFLGNGVLAMLRVAVLAIALSLIIAVLLSLVRLSDHPRLRIPLPALARKAIRVPAGAFVETFRSVPLFMLVIYSYIALPRLGVNLSPFWAGVAALTVYTSCVMSEIVRAGILSLERGQFEAAEALGLSYLQRLRLVVLPQALRRMVPAMVSQLITLVKDTSLLSVIGVLELSRRGLLLAQINANPIEVFLVLMVMYFIVNFSLSLVARRLEVQPGRAGRAVAPAVIGQEDQVRVAAPGR
jgi:His/Glu/Gln/Arg/opine family amino acid ABC transporter permease subunit